MPPLGGALQRDGRGGRPWASAGDGCERSASDFSLARCQTRQQRGLAAPGAMQTRFMAAVTAAAGALPTIISAAATDGVGGSGTRGGSGNADHDSGSGGGALACFRSCWIRWRTQTLLPRPTSTPSLLPRRMRWRARRPTAKGRVALCDGVSGERVAFAGHVVDLTATAPWSTRRRSG